MVQLSMARTASKLVKTQITVAHERRLEAIHLQEIEGNSVDAADLAMFAMFDRKGWSHEQRRAYIIAQAKGEPVPLAAE